MRKFEGRHIKYTPETLIKELVEDAMLCAYYYPEKKLGPGQYLQQRVSDEHREILKNLKSEDLQNYRISDTPSKKRSSTFCFSKI